MSENKLTPEAEIFEKYANWKHRRAILRMVTTPEEINNEVTALLKAQGLFTTEQVISFCIHNLGLTEQDSRKWLNEYSQYLEAYNNPTPPKTDV